MDSNFSAAGQNIHHLAVERAILSICCCEAAGGGRCWCSEELAELTTLTLLVLPPTARMCGGGSACVALPNAADDEELTRSDGCCVSACAGASVATADSPAVISREAPEPEVAAPGTSGRLRLPPPHVPGSSSIASITVLRCFVVGTSDQDLEPLLYLFGCYVFEYTRMCVH